MDLTNQNTLLHQFAACIFKEVQEYLAMHQDEFIEWERQNIKKEKENNHK